MGASKQSLTHTTDSLVAIWRSFGAFERDRVCCGTVTVQQCLVLQSLRDSEQTVTELATAHGASPSSMTRLIDGLVKKTWVSRHREGEDRRKAHIALTADGRTEADRLHNLTCLGVGSVMAHIPASEHEAVTRALALVQDALAAAREDDGGVCC